MRVRCPHCEAALQLTGESDDGPIDCPKCAKPFTIPKRPKAEAASTTDDSPWSSLPVDNEPPAQEKPAPSPRKSGVETAPRGRPTYGKKDGTPKKKFPVWIAVGAGVLLLAVGGILIAVLGGRGKGKPADQVQTKPADTPPPRSTPITPNPPAPNSDPAGKPNPKAPPAEIVELFRGEVNLPTPSKTVASLRPATGVVPDPLSLSLPPDPANPKPNPAAGKMTLEEVKKAAVYIKVVGDGGRSSGSGFLIRADGETGLIATNHHVIRDALGSGTRVGGKGKVTAVFDSGLPTETSYPAEIVAFDPEVDLAILRIEDVAKLPRPIDSRLAVTPTETQAIMTYGFPYGQALATGGRSPAITIGKGAVSSLRRDEGGKVVTVQLDAALNPGNSGGPVLDADGRLVGIAVATIRGSSGIGLAIPASALNAMLEGHILYPVFLPIESNESEATFAAALPVVDPLGRIKSISYHVWAGEGKAPDAPTDPAKGIRPLPGSTRFDLANPTRGLAVGEVRLPNRGKSQTVMVQTAITPVAGAPITSPPVPFQMKVSEVRIATDAIPMSTFHRNISRYNGQDVVVRANMDLSSSPNWNLFELGVWTESDDPTGGLVFLADEKLVADFPETPFPEKVPVRLTVRVGKTGQGNRTHVRVTRVDLIGRGDRIVRSLPSGGGADEDLFSTLVRQPDRFSGQSVVLDADLLPKVGDVSQLTQLFLALPGGQVPRNLVFIASPDLASPVRELNLKKVTSVRATARVTEQKANGPMGQMRVVVVQKIELLSEDGQVFKVLR